MNGIDNTVVDAADRFVQAKFPLVETYNEEHLFQRQLSFQKLVDEFRYIEKQVDQRSTLFHAYSSMFRIEQLFDAKDFDKADATQCPHKASHEAFTISHCAWASLIHYSPKHVVEIAQGFSDFLAIYKSLNFDYPQTIYLGFISIDPGHSGTLPTVYLPALRLNGNENWSVRITNEFGFLESDFIG